MSDEAPDKYRLIHDIRSPLSTVSVNAELGKLYLERGDNKESLEQVFDTIAHHCNLCVQRLEDLETLILEKL